MLFAAHASDCLLPWTEQFRLPQWDTLKGPYSTNAPSAGLREANAHLNMLAHQHLPRASHQQLSSPAQSYWCGCDFYPFTSLSPPGKVCAKCLASFSELNFSVPKAWSLGCITILPGLSCGSRWRQHTDTAEPSCVHTVWQLWCWYTPQ